MSNDEICFKSATELAALIRGRQLSPVEVAEAVIERIETFNPDVFAFCGLDHALVRAAARRAEQSVVRGEELGPLHGIPVSVKDLIFTTDFPTVGGSKMYVDFVPETDDIVVERIRAAGAIVLGKTNVPDFGYGPAVDPVFGTTKNPWDLSRSPAGSSGGSAAAVAMGMGPVSLGSDGGGSIRVPASFCGIYGLNPSYGRVPLYPGTRDTRFPGFSGWESLERIGPMTRTVADAALVLDVLKGPDPRDRHSIPDEGIAYAQALDGDLAGLRVGWTLSWGGPAQVDAEVAALISDAADTFASMGADVEMIGPVLGDQTPAFDALAALDADLRSMRALVDRYPEGEAPPRLRGLVKAERTFLSASDAVAARKDLYNALWRFFDRYDLLLTPTAPVAAFSLEFDGPTEIGGRPVTEPMPLARFTAPISMAGNPSASIPCGWTSDGLPVGLQTSAITSTTNRCCGPRSPSSVPAHGEPAARSQRARMRLDRER